MIDSLELILQAMFETSIAQVLEDSTTNNPPNSPSVTFAPPNSNFPPQNGPRNLLDVYLVDIRENRKLRSNDRRTLGRRSPISDDLNVTQSPGHIDCHYVATAWVRFSGGNTEEDVQAEHRLLYYAAAALLRNNPINVREILQVPPTADDRLNGIAIGDQNFQQLPLNEQTFIRVDRIIRDRLLQVDVLPPEGFPKIAEFWGLMGTKVPWRPVLYFIVTLPVEYQRRSSGPLVHSIRTIYEKDFPIPLEASSS